MPEGDTTRVLREILAADRDGADGAASARAPMDAGACVSADVDALKRAVRAYREATACLRHDEPLLPPGDRLGDFEIEGLLAQGGMATVYHARQLSLDGRPVALKVLPARATDERDVARFRREARALAALHHPHLAEVYGFGEERGRLFYAMRLERGASLDELFGRQGRLPPPRRLAVRWASQIAAALAVVHRAGLVHRDVKPANIVLRLPPDGALVGADVVLVDFGLVRSATGSGDTATRGEAATPHYAAPEQLIGHDVDARADVFSLGVTLHDLLAGRIGRRPGRAAAGLPRLSSLVPDVDRDLDAVVAMASDPDPEWRYANGAALAEDLGAWLSGRSVVARRRSVLERARRWVHDHPRKILRSIGVAAGLAALAAALLAIDHAAEAAARGQRAWRDGRLPDVEAAAADVPWALRPFLLTDPAARAAAQRLLRRAAGDPLVSLAADQADPARGRSASLESAVAHLAVSADTGEPADPLVFAFVEGELGKLIRRESVGDDAARLVARLFHERPDLTRAASVRSAPFRGLLRPLLDDRTATPAARLHALSALAGCGVAADLLPLLGVAAAHPNGSEEQRLAVESARCILARAERCGCADEVDFAALWSALSPLLREHVWPAGAGQVPDSWSGRVGIHRLAVCALLAERRGGGSRDAAPLLPKEWMAALDSGSGAAGDAPVYLAACDDGRVRAWIRGGAREGNGRWGPWEQELGWLCGALDDGTFASEVRARLLDLPSDRRESSSLASFEYGLESGRQDLAGQLDFELPDADTRLGAAQSVTPLPLAAAIEAPRPQDGVAHWEFREASWVSGWARGATVTIGVPWRDESGSWCLRLHNPGGSRVDLAFSVEAPLTHGVLELRQLANRRALLPNEGDVLLDVLLDGVAVAEDLLVSDISSFTYAIVLPAGGLTPGPHVIDIRMDRRSTTVWRLEWADLRVR